MNSPGRSSVFAALLLLMSLTLHAASPGTITSRSVDSGTPLTLDPAAPLWTGASPVTAHQGRWGEPLPGKPTEIRSRWSPTDLYLFFVCPYERLHLKPDPTTTAETNHLWDWDVAEAFIGADPASIRHYTEYEVSPQGEWVDLDIDRGNPKSPGIRWDSGFEAKARIDRAAKTWYAAMRIPMKVLGITPAAGGQLRVNFYRIEGGPPSRTYITWQPTHSETYHVPEAFGRLVLEK
jgi:hypothetical protein